MAKSTPNYNLIEVMAGVQPLTDYTPSATKHFTYADKIRFQNGVAKKIGGWREYEFNYGAPPNGIVRSIYSTIILGRYYQLLGTSGYLYSNIAGALTNITPLETVSSAIPNSISTTYGNLTNNPFTTVSGSMTVRVAVSNFDAYRIGDSFNISGATAFNGLTSTDLNGSKVVRAIGIGYLEFRSTVNATASGTGGGAAAIFSSGLLRIDKATHGYEDDYRVKIDLSSDVGGILAVAINIEYIIRKTETNAFYVYVSNSLPTSSVTGGGGANTVVYRQIDAGLVNETSSIGYGSGLYGTGLYGTMRESSSTRQFPRIWFWDKYGESIVGTAGNQTQVYQWMGDINDAPKIVENSPSAVNYVFTSDNILVTLGAGGVENRIFTSDQNDITQWTSSSTNQVYDDDIEGAGRFLSHCPVEDYNLIFTENKTYKFRYIGLPLLWDISPVDDSIGIIAPMARCSVNGVAFWMGTDNFYFFRQGLAEVIPANSQLQSTCLRYVFDNINWGQKSKFFAWYNRQYKEVWFHYCSSNSNECNRVVVVDILNYTWTPHTLDRTAAEYPDVIMRNPFLINQNVMYQHEIGNDANTEPLKFTFTTNRRFFGKDNAKLMAIVPDSSQFGTVDLKIEGFRFPQSQSPIMVQPSTGSFAVTPTTERIPIMGAARYIQYTISGEQLDQDFMAGAWMEEIQKGPTE